ncbi:sulfotransferase [Novosphingobium sp.]|uniref:sulfotransferase family protein n=1 Tax=Novosphingobium sp. TaxID=1874826 RepID=UPI00260A7B79|nr:sulfotransferase [Novosphingobium sp.]
MDTRHAPPDRFSTSAERLHEIVAQELGSDDFGPADYRAGLEMLLHSMDYDPCFTPGGRERAWSQVIGVLRSRAAAYRAMRENPGFADAPIVSPVVITGMPRTGTTALHQLMAFDERFQGLQTWLLEAPRPRPPRETWDRFPEFHRTAAWLDRRHADAPVKKTAHAMAAEAVDECCLLLWQGFVSNLWTVGWSAASYDAWWQGQSEAPSYAHYRKCVQLIGSSAPERRWLLKNPGHIARLDLLLAVFPDARVIVMHRDPARAIPSLVSLLMGAHAIMETGRREQRGAIMIRRETAKWAEAMVRAEEIRARHPAQVLDVVQHDLHRDPMAVITRIYAFIGMDLPEPVAAAMRQHGSGRHGRSAAEHGYDIADYGINEQAVREAFGDYVERFGLVGGQR